MPHIRDLFLPDPAATDRLGRALAPILRAGDCLCLSGDLGAGKSHLARSIVQARQEPHGAVEDVPSPTYTLMQTYSAGDLTIVHADLYRLGESDELTELGLDEALDVALCLVEWPDRLGSMRPADALDIALSPRDGGRRAILSGEGWARRLEDMHLD